MTALVVSLLPAVMFGNRLDLMVMTFLALSGDLHLPQHPQTRSGRHRKPASGVSIAISLGSTTGPMTAARNYLPASLDSDMTVVQRVVT